MVATVVSMVDIKPAETAIIHAAEDGPTTSELTLTMRKGETATLTGVRSNVRFVEPKLEPIAGSDPPAYRLTLTVPATTPFGRTLARITIATTSEAEPEVRAHARIEKGIVATPVSMYLGVLPATMKEPLERVILLMRQSGSFALKGVACDDPAVKLRVETVRPGECYKLTIRYAGGWPAGWVQRRITVETDSARQPTIVIPLTARVGP
jgi:hypothetical protein